MIDAPSVRLIYQSVVMLGSYVAGRGTARVILVSIILVSIQSPRDLVMPVLGCGLEQSAGGQTDCKTVNVRPSTESELPLMLCSFSASLATTND